MERSYCGLAAIAASVCLALAGCNSSVTAPQVQPVPTFPNISGDYNGTISDSQNGSGTATATFAQHGSSVGGAITITGATSTLTSQASITVSANNSFTGALVADYPNGATCTYSTSGAYDPNAQVLSGTYQAVSGCTGATGKYALNQQCYNSPASIDRRRVMRVLHC